MNDPLDTVRQIETLDAEDKEYLQELCGVLAGCLGEKPQSSAMVISWSGYDMHIHTLNMPPQQALDALTAAKEMYDAYHIGAVPPKEKMN